MRFVVSGERSCGQGFEIYQAASYNVAVHVLFETQHRVL